MAIKGPQKLTITWGFEELLCLRKYMTYSFTFKFMNRTQNITLKLYVILEAYFSYTFLINVEKVGRSLEGKVGSGENDIKEKC